MPEGNYGMGPPKKTISWLRNLIYTLEEKLIFSSINLDQNMIFFRFFKSENLEFMPVKVISISESSIHSCAKIQISNLASFHVDHQIGNKKAISEVKNKNN